MKAEIRGATEGLNEICALVPAYVSTNPDQIEVEGDYEEPKPYSATVLPFTALVTNFREVVDKLKSTAYDLKKQADELKDISIQERDTTKVASLKGELASLKDKEKYCAVQRAEMQSKLVRTEAEYMQCKHLCQQYELRITALGNQPNAPQRIEQQQGANTNYQSLVVSSTNFVTQEELKTLLEDSKKYTVTFSKLNVIADKLRNATAGARVSSGGIGQSENKSGGSNERDNPGNSNGSSDNSDDDGSSDNDGDKFDQLGLNELRRRLRVCHKQVKALKEEVNDLSKPAEKIEDPNLALLRSEIHRLEQDIDKTRKEAAEAQRRAEKYKSQLLSARDWNRRLLVASTGFKQEVEECRQHGIKLQQQVDDLNKAVQEKEKEVKASDAARQQADANNQTLRQNLRGAEQASKFQSHAPALRKKVTDCVS